MATTITASITTEHIATTNSAVKCRPIVSELSIVAMDFIALLLAATSISYLFGNTYSIWRHVLPILAILPIFVLFGLYPGVHLHPVNEIRRSSCTAAALALGTLFGVIFKQTPRSDVFLLSVWIVGTMLIPLFRGLLRQLCSNKSWWGYPVFVVGEGRAAEAVIKRLQKNPQLGLKPYILFDPSASAYSEYEDVSGVPVISSISAMESLAKVHKVKHAIAAMPGLPHQQVVDLIETNAASIRNILSISNSPCPSSLEIRTRDLSQMLAIEVPRTLLQPGARMAKRAIDLALVLSAGVVILPLVILICILIKLDSMGPVFYGHRRVGRARRTFKVWKFRSMAVNGDAILKAHLQDNPAAAEEWELTRKLKNDPRITRIGKWLRRSSLDELPQLWNVIRDEMSLVGPRPVVEAESAKYGAMFSQYVQVAPGLTGLWQVSGRNNTTYEERIEFDVFYVRNWSPWLDLYLLSRTFAAVIRKEGAY